MWEDASGVLGGELLTVFDAHRQLQTSLDELADALATRSWCPSRVVRIRREVVSLRENQKTYLPSSWEGDLLDRQQCFCHGWQK